MPPRPPRPGLELLIRKRGAEGAGASFEIKVYAPDRAFLRMKPRRVEEAVAEVAVLDEATGRVFALRLREGDRVVRLSEHEYRIWERMDGRHSIQDLAAALVFEFGRFDFDEIRSTLGRLRGAGLVQTSSRSRLLRAQRVPGGPQVQSLARAVATFDRRWEEGVDRAFTRLHRALRPLWTRRALAGWVALALAGTAAWAVLRAGGGLDTAPLPTWAAALQFAGLLPLCMAVHELAHGMACKAHGRRVRAVGITVLDYVLPSFYVDVTDMSLSTRAGRVVVDLAGPLANLVLVGGATAAAALSADPWARAVWVGVADVNLALALFTAWPFHGLQEDGYHALSELLRVSLLRRRAGALLQAALGRAPEGLDRPRGPAALYLGGLVGTWAAVGLLVGAWLAGRLPGS
ncbi:hypothetical protein L6R53_19510 [Myxococcota bacterium]|nr:hypothetical protein [Myxococcota bacterium]